MQFVASRVHAGAAASSKRTLRVRSSEVIQRAACRDARRMLKHLVEDLMKSLIRAAAPTMVSMSLAVCCSQPSLLALSSAAMVVAASPALAQDSPTPAVNARKVAAEIGLDAAALAAAGIDAAGCGAIVQRLAAAPEPLEGLETAKNAMVAAGDALELARQAAQDGSVEAAATIPEREAAVQSASASLAALRAALRGHALDGVSPEAVAKLNAIDAARKRRVPTEFMVVARTEGDWEQLERAVRREERCQRTGEPLEPEYAVLLANTRAEPAVASAAASIATLLPSVEAALVAD